MFRITLCAAALVVARGFSPPTFVLRNADDAPVLFDDARTAAATFRYQLAYLDVRSLQKFDDVRRLFYEDWDRGVTWLLGIKRYGSSPQPSPSPTLPDSEIGPTLQ